MLQSLFFGVSKRTNEDWISHERHYSDSHDTYPGCALDPDAGLRLLIGLYSPGRPIPEGRMLPDDPDERAATREAARLPGNLGMTHGNQTPT